MDFHVDEDQLATLHGRAFLYELAHVVFGGEPNEDLLGVLASEDSLMTLGVLAKDCEAVAALASYAERFAEDGSNLAEEAALCLSAYNKTIAGLGAKRTSHPWESAYTSSKKLLMQVETLEVRNFYRAFGYLPQMYPKVADDHISLECAFLAALAGRSIAAFEENDSEMLAKLVEGQRAFLNEHLLKWVDAYVLDLHEDAPNSLYDLTASALAALARQDEVFLGTIDA